jgi:hypothetical protein
MRAWENRPDTVVSDEPLYAFYLHRTALPHPGHQTVIVRCPELSGQSSIRMMSGKVLF